MAQRIHAWWNSEARRNVTDHGLFLGMAGTLTGCAIAGVAAFVFLH